MKSPAIVIVSVGVSLFLLVGCSGASVWTAEVTQELRIDTAGLTSLDVQTHNGSITHKGRDGGEAAVLVTATRKAGGATHKDADAALAAIEVYTEKSDDGTLQIAWRWREPKQRHWAGNVSFDISAPGGLAFNAVTHNGALRLTGVTADVKVVTHNGAISVDCSDGCLDAESHNGRIDVAFQGKEIRLETHNGRIEADLAKCANIGGSITTYNGSILVRVGPDTSADCMCVTHNGRIRCAVKGGFAKAVAAAGRSCHEVSGVLGKGGPHLSMTTHNGSIRVE